MRASAVEEAATSKPTTAASDKIFVMINLLRFPPFHCCVNLPAQLVGYRNDRNLGLVQNWAGRKTDQLPSRAFH